MNKFLSFFKALINSVKDLLRIKATSQTNSDFESESIILEVFNRLRQDFNLGVSEYLAAIQAVKGGFGAENQDKLKEILQLLWCPPVEQYHFNLIWESVISDSSKDKNESISAESNTHKSSEIAEETPPPTPAKVESVQTQSTSNLSPVPVRVPFTPAKVDQTLELENYWPISRRYMIYIWRYLQRPVADGAEDLLDVNATVEKTANQGFFLAPVYRRRESNHAHLILLVDQNGSMTPFHRFSRDLVETAQYKSTIEQVDVYYFHNVPTTSLYCDQYLTNPIPLEEALKDCDRDTSIFIVSDAGAARGYRRLERIQETTEALFKIKQLTNQVVWLNPMPKKRWVSTSAQIISHLIQMYQMNNDGLSNAINYVCGQSLQNTSLNMRIGD